MVSDDASQHRLPFVPKGFMALGSKVYKCAGAGEACPGAFMSSSVEVMCDYGGFGVACAECPSGSRFDGARCIECGELGHFGHVIFVVLAIVSIIFLVSGATPKETGGK